MEHDWKKNYSQTSSGRQKTVMRQIWRVILKGVTLFGRRYDTLKQFVW